MSLVLSPIYHRDEYNTPVEQETTAYFQEVLFDPLRAILGESLRLNESTSALRRALMAGTVWYAEGAFTGEFTSEISRELRAIGARLNPSAKTFILPLVDLPLELRGRVAESKRRSEELHKVVLAFLAAAATTVVSAPLGLDYTKAVDKTLEELQKQFVRTVSTVEGLPTPTPLPPGFAESLRQDLTEAVEGDIKNFTLQQIAELRAKVQQNLAAGGRTDRLARIIEVDYGVAQRKARFIAENETSRLVARFRQQRYESLGITQYEWQTQEDERVRADHDALNGRVFSWSNPPVADRATGTRGHPGELWNCRCVPLPIFNLR